MDNVFDITSHFQLHGVPTDIQPLGNGLINDTYKVFIEGQQQPAYVLQHINNAIFQDVDMLQDNIEKVTSHIRQKLLKAKVDDIDRKVLSFIKSDNSKTYYFDGEKYWRMMVFIKDSFTYESVTPEFSKIAGKSFGAFEAMLSDLDEPLGEIIKDFHNIEFRLKQLRQAVADDKAGRVQAVRHLLDEIERNADAMCLGEQLYRDGQLPKRICHCDTKVNNMLFDADGNVLCIIDLDTVMPSFVFSDFGDFLRSAANTGKEDDRDLDNVNFNMAIFEAFTQGYLDGTQSFLLPIERDNLPYAATLFPYMQAVRFLGDYLNGDTYYKTAYPEHNLDRTNAQWKLFESAKSQLDAMNKVVENGWRYEKLPIAGDFLSGYTKVEAGYNP